jgi:hypothetical protein
MDSIGYFAWLIRRVLIEWLDVLSPYTQYSALQAIERYRWSTYFTVHTQSNSQFSLARPGNGFITVSLSLQITHGIFFSQPNFFAIILKLPIPKTRPSSIPRSYPGRLAFRNLTLHSLLDYCSALGCRTLSHFCTDHEENTISIVKETCWLVRCLAVDVLLLRAYNCEGTCLPSRCLAIGLYVTIYIPLTFLLTHDFGQDV